MPRPKATSINTRIHEKKSQKKVNNCTEYMKIGNDYILRNFPMIVWK